jgi:branched-chain amino acid transport system substrate-binding protein
MVATVCAALAVGCGGSDDGDGGSGDSGSGGGGSSKESVTVYSSLPLQGASRPLSESMVNGIKLALDAANYQAGKFTIKYVSLDDSTAQAGAWTPEAASANARKAAQDESAVAYIGEGNSGASAVSMPLLNEAGLLQVAGSNTAVGLTTDGPGSTPGEPDKYYPTGKRHYVRVVPNDTVQSAALVKLMTDDGCTKLAIADDKEVYGAGLANGIKLAAKEEGLEIASGSTGIDPKSPNYRALADAFKSAGADCFIYAAIVANNAVQVYKDVAFALPDAQLYAADGLAESGFVDPGEGGIPAEVADRLKVTFAALAPEEYPEAGQEYFETYRKTYGRDPESYAIYAYECMQLVLDAIERAGDKGNDREAVLEAAFATQRESALGPYQIDENGDTTLGDYGFYSIEGGKLEFAGKITLD